VAGRHSGARGIERAIALHHIGLVKRDAVDDDRPDLDDELLAGHADDALDEQLRRIARVTKDDDVAAGDRVQGHLDGDALAVGERRRHR
jgi:hypothetical protein